MAITISGSGITSANIADGTIVSGDIADGTIVSGDIADGTIAVADVADNAITEAKIADAAVVNLKSGRKNLIINGDMRISQRGDYSVTPKSVAVSSPTYVLDRWLTYGSGTAVNASQGTVTLPNGTHAYTFKTEAVSAGGSWLHPAQYIEWDKSYRGKTITLSAWVKTNLSGQGMRVCDGATCIVKGTIPSDETWNYISETFTLQSASDPVQFQAHPAFGGSTVVGSYTEFTHMQVEFGSVATDFEHRSYGEELALCQRYFYENNHIGAGVWNSATTFFGSLNNPVPFRTTPTITTKSGVWTNINIEQSDAYDITSVSIGHGSGWSAGFTGNPMFTASVTGARTTGDGGVVTIDTNNDVFFFDAEL